MYYVMVLMDNRQLGALHLAVWLISDFFHERIIQQLLVYAYRERPYTHALKRHCLS